MEENPQEETKKLRPKRLRLKDHTDKGERVSYEKPEIKSQEQLKLEEEEKKKKAAQLKYLEERKRIGVPVSGIFVPPDLDVGKHF